MKQHLGRREREARKLRTIKRRGQVTIIDCHGVVTLKLGRKKSMETVMRNRNTILLKKKFSGCVVDAER